MKKISTLISGLGLSLVILSGCFTTERVKTLSSASLAGLKTSESIPYSRTQFCWDEAFYQGNIKLEVTRVNGVDVTALKKPKVCKEAEAADSAKRVLQAVVYAYFNALKNLSDDKVVEYKVDGITKFLKKGNYLGLEVDDKTIGAMNTISSKIMAAVAGNYRNKRIKIFIRESDESIGNLLDRIDKYYELLAVQMTNNSGNIVNYYTGFNQETSPYIQTVARNQMLQKLDNTEDIARKIVAHRRVLQGIRKSHHEMTAKINTVSNKELKKFLVEKTSEVILLISEFNNL